MGMIFSKYDCQLVERLVEQVVESEFNQQTTEIYLALAKTPAQKPMTIIRQRNQLNDKIIYILYNTNITRVQLIIPQPSLFLATLLWKLERRLRN